MELVRSIHRGGIFRGADSGKMSVQYEVLYGA